MKKLLLSLLLLLPIGVFATTAVPWQQTNLNDGFIFPAKVNGNIQGIIVSASSSLQNFTFTTATGTSATTTNLFSSLASTTKLFVGTGNGCLQVTNGQVLSTGSNCGSGSGAVSSVTDDGRGTLTISPTTGAVLAGLNLANANTWSALQTFGNILVTGSSTLQNFTGLNSTTTNATTTTIFSTTASSSRLFTANFSGANLSSCTGTNSLTWTAGLFGCTAIPQGTVTSVTGSWPITSSGGATPNITWSGLASTTNLVTGDLLYSTGVNTFGQVATSTLTASSPLTGSFVHVGSSGTLGCQTASGSQAGCLSSTDWNTFNGKGSGSVTSVATNNGITGGTITTTGTLSLDQSFGAVWTAASTTFVNGVTTGRATTTSATTTNLFATTASTTNLYLATGGCSGSNALNVVSGLVTCGAVSGTGVSGVATTSLLATLPITVTKTTSSITYGSLFGTTTDTGLGDNLFVYTSAGGVLTGAASSSLDLPNTALQHSTISGIALGNNLDSLSNDGATLSGSSFNGSANVSNWAINLGNQNVWTGASTTFVGGVTIGTATTTSATSTNLFATTASTSKLYLGTGTGCLSVTSGLVSANGASCGTTSGTVTSVGLSSPNSTLTIGSSPITTSGTITGDLNLATGNIWTAASTTFVNGVTIGNATTTNATTTTLFATTASTSRLFISTGSGLLKNSSGQVVAAILGTDYVNGSGTSGHCVSWGSSNSLTDAGSACGSGGGAAGTFSTTTSTVTGELINYSNNNTDIVSVGGTATTSDVFYFDPNTSTANFGKQGIASDAIQSFGSSTALWSIGKKVSDLSFDIASSSSLGTNNYFVLSATGSPTFSTLGGSTGCIQANSLGNLSNTGTACGSGSGSSYPFPVATNATTTQTNFNGGLTSLASTTIGNSTQTGGLTIAGTATTTATSTVGRLVTNPYFQVGIDPSYGYLINDRANFTGNLNDYSAVNAYNVNAGACATADLTAANDLNSTAQNFADLGHTSSGFTGSACTNNPFTGFGKNSTYLFDPTGYMNFALGSTAATSSFNWFTGGYAAANEKMTLTNVGDLGIGTSTPAFLLESSTSTAPQLSLDNKSAGTNAQHLIMDWTGTSFNIGTSSDSTFTSTSTALQLTPSGPSGIGVGTTTKVGILNLGDNPNETGLASTTIITSGKFQIDTYNNAGARVCIEISSINVFTLVAGACGSN